MGLIFGARGFLVRNEITKLYSRVFMEPFSCLTFSDIPKPAEHKARQDCKLLLPCCCAWEDPKP